MIQFLPRTVDIILERLLDKYKSIISLINSRLEPLSVNEVEMLQLANQSRLEKFEKDVAAVNLTEGPSLKHNNSPFSSESY